MPEFPTTIVLAGGMATRLKEVAKQVPKAMLEVAGEPFVAHQLRLLKREGVSKVVFCVAHLSSQIEQYVGDGSQFELDVVYSHDGKELLGTGGAIKKAQSLVEDTFAVMYGDTYLDISMPPIYESFQNSGKQALMTVLANENRWDKSNVWYENGEIKVYDKSTQLEEMRFIDYGLSIFKKPIFEKFPDREAFDLESVFKKLVSLEQLAGFEVSQRFYEIGSLDGLQETAQYLSEKRSN